MNRALYLIGLLIIVASAQLILAQNPVTYNPVNWPLFKVQYRTRGEATYYSNAAAIKGNCGADANGPSDIYLAAVNKLQYDLSWSCGGCALVSGPSGNITVRFVDQCPECLNEDLDLSTEAFAAITNNSLVLGRVRISWYMVPCPVSGNVAFRVKLGSNQYWGAIQVFNTRFPVRKVEFRSSTNGNWLNLGRTDYNYWLRVDGTGRELGMGLGPYYFRVTSATGQVLSQGPFTLSPGVIQQGSQQFSPTPLPPIPLSLPSRTPSASLTSLRSSTATSLPPTQTPLPPTQTPLPPTQSSLPLPPTQTPVPLPPTQSPLPLPPTESPLPLPPRQTPLPLSPTENPLPLSPTQTPPSTPVPPTPPTETPAPPTLTPTNLPLPPPPATTTPLPLPATPTPSPSPSPIPIPLTWTPTAPTQRPASPAPSPTRFVNVASSTCTVQYSVSQQWSNGLGANIVISSSVRMTSWTLTWSLPIGQSIISSWNVALSTSGQKVTAKNLGWNGSIGPGSSKSLGYTAKRVAGAVQRPTGFSLNGVPCVLLY
mmetsp:Transcript_38915/g.63052  ORF Transcript_38915/g.63052 Transcript_38915/m.63052 type:complete len:539 (+) Transcript_38915:359-1975(+)